MTFQSLIAEPVTIRGNGGDAVEGYWARPLGAGPFPSIVVIHHLPGWDEWCKEVTRRFAHQGYAALDPNLYHRAGPGSPDDVAARVRAAGGVSDDQVVGDVAGAIDFLRTQPNANGRVAVIGFCSGGRHAYLVGCRVKGVDAVVDCWGGGVIVDDPSQLSAQRPVAPIDLSAGLQAPLLGIFGNDDRSPTPAQVDRTEVVLKQLGATYEFHRYDGAPHAFFNTERVSYRPEQAVDGWQKVFAFLAKHLATAPASSAAAKG